MPNRQDLRPVRRIAEAVEMAAPLGSTAKRRRRQRPTKVAAAVRLRRGSRRTGRQRPTFERIVEHLPASLVLGRTTSTSSSAPITCPSCDGGRAVAFERVDIHHDAAGRPRRGVHAIQVPLSGTTDRETNIGHVPRAPDHRMDAINACATRPFFDLDGTVVDSGAIILASMRHATREVLGRDYSDGAVPETVGGPAWRRSTRYAPDQVDGFVDVYRARDELTTVSRRVHGIEGMLVARLHEEEAGCGVVRAEAPLDRRGSRSPTSRSDTSSRRSSAIRPSGTSPTRSRSCSAPSGWDEPGRDRLRRRLPVRHPRGEGAAGMFAVAP